MSRKRHPMAFLRPALGERGMVSAADLGSLGDGQRVSLAGLVLFRQRPGTASGTIFITIEDETGAANLIVWSSLSERSRRPVYGAKLLACTGRLQREGQVLHVIAERLHDWTAQPARIRSGARTFRLPSGEEGRRRPGAGGHAMGTTRRDFR